MIMAYSTIIIAGDGIIGNSIAYYLAKRGISCTIVDPVGIAPAASGKGGGFLARNWSDGCTIQDLQRQSFDLHAELANHFGADTIDYRRLECISVSCDESNVKKKPSGKKLEGVEWADMNAVGCRKLGGTDTIAQVHPKKLCNAMWKFSQESVGSKLVVGKVVRGIVKDGSIRGVQLHDSTIIDGDALVVACGPWTDSAQSWFGIDNEHKLPQMQGVKYHSILIKSPRVLNQSVFFQGHGDPEVYPRPDGDAYITGFPDPAIIVTELPGMEEVRSEKVYQLIDAMKKTSSELGDIPPHTTQACYLPTTKGGIPIIGHIPGVHGAYVASGHGCWGILNGPATGEAIAELLMDGKTTSLDLSLFDVSSRQ
jgi:glycine/D-amino acid oxidase-like deaminating enzyme